MMANDGAQEDGREPRIDGAQPRRRIAAKASCLPGAPQPSRLKTTGPGDLAKCLKGVVPLA
jgi:hypothetical protein